MALKGILAIGGKPGLFKHVAQSKNAIIVEEITTGKRIPAYATAKISALEDIAIYTETDEVQLEQVFKNIKEHRKGDNVGFEPKKASLNDLTQLMEEILPNYDQERVYVSDMKKIFSWYNFLHKYDMLDFSENENESEEEPVLEDVEPSTEG